VVIQIKPRNQILLYTDGIAECIAPDGDIFGEERLLNFIHYYLKKPNMDLLDAIELRINNFRGDKPPSDDITILLLERKPQSI